MDVRHVARKLECSELPGPVVELDEARDDPANDETSMVELLARRDNVGVASEAGQVAAEREKSRNVILGKHRERAQSSNEVFESPIDSEHGERPGSGGSAFVSQSPEPENSAGNDLLYHELLWVAID